MSFFKSISIAIVGLLLAGCGKSEHVVVYTSQDQMYAEPIFAAFTRQTGIKVLPVFDSESVKTAGLIQRLIAERDNPKADVFWSNEEMLFTELLNKGALDTNAWSYAGFRTRRLIINTNKVSFADAPKCLADLTSPRWSHRVAIAYPVYGTTAAHMVALRQLWGDAKWQKWCAEFAANKPFVVDGNSLVVRLVGSGEAWLGLTDSDDLAAGLRNGLPIASVPANAFPVSDEFLRIRSSVGILRGAPNPTPARYLFAYLIDQSTTRKLVEANALEGVVAGYGLALKQPAPVQETLEILRSVFARQ
jgi:iron(III) transport system substrate-binding protein